MCAISMSVFAGRKFTKTSKFPFFKKEKKTSEQKKHEREAKILRTRSQACLSYLRSVS